MPIDRARYKGYSYIRIEGFSQRLIEKLLSELERGLPQGVALPNLDGIDVGYEYLPAKDAVLLILDWLKEHNVLGEQELTHYENVIGKASYKAIAQSLQLAYDGRIKDPHKLFSSRLAENLANNKEVQRQATTNKGKTYNPAENIQAYYRLYQQIGRLAATGVPAEMIRQLIPRGLSGLDDRLTEARLIDVVISHLPELVSARRTAGTELERGKSLTAAAATAREMEHIIDKYAPDLEGLNNFTRTDEFQGSFYNLVTALEDVCQKNDIDLATYEKISIASALSAPLLLPAQNELVRRLAPLLGLATPRENEQAARAIVSALTSSYGKRLTTAEFIAHAAKQYNLSPAVVKQISHAAHDAGLDGVLQYYQHANSISLQEVHLTASARRLAALGINPLHAYFTPEDLLKEARSLLPTPTSPLTFQDSQTQLQARYDQLVNSGSGHYYELAQLKHWLERFDTVNFLETTDDKTLRRLAIRNRNERWFYDQTSRFHTFQTNFFNKWYQFEENLPWNKFPRKFFEWYDKKAEQIAIPIPFTKTKVPILRFWPWVFGGIDTLKKVGTLRAYAWVSRGHWYLPKFAQSAIKFSLRSYHYGGHTVGGALFHAQGRAWGKFLSWSIAKSGFGGVFKYSAKFGTKTVARAAYRTALRFALKLGGKAIGKLGAKAAAALALAGTTIGAILSAGLAVLMIFDVLKLGYDFVREFISNVDFRNFVLKVGAIGNAAVLFVVNLPVILIGALGLATTVLPLALFITVGSIAFGTLYHRMASTAWQIDPGVGIITNIVCNLAGTDPTSVATDPQIPSGARPTLVAGQCIYDLLVKFGINPLTAENAVGSAWAGFAAALGNATAASIIQTSAVGQGVFQCVGYIAAAGEMAGKGFNPTNACLYVNNPPEGYSWTTKPTVGCFFVIASSTCSQCGLENAPANSCGHVGIVSAVNGAIINAMDANGTSPWGSVRVTAQFPTSSIAGYMCP